MRPPLRPSLLRPLCAVASVLLAASTLGGCGDDTTPRDASPGTDPSADASETPSTDTASEDGADINETDPSDSGESDASPDTTEPLDMCSDELPSRAWLLSEVTVGRIASGVSNGFDLNVRAGHATNCGKRTFRRPDGLTAINNQFGTLMPAIELTELGALEDLIQTAINDGFLLLMVEMDRLADPEFDECVDLRVLRGEGPPILGNDQRPLTGLTFDRYPDGLLGEAMDVQVVDGALEAGPFDLAIQFVFFGNDILLNAYGSWVHFEMRPDGTAFGFIGGALSVPELVDFAMGLNDGGDIGEQLARFVAGAADLFPNEDGVCEHLSIVLEFEARPAYFFE